MFTAQMVQSVAMAVGVVSAIGLVGAVILVLASHFMQVKVDERIPMVQEVLPAVNCGACGYAGCADYAAAVVAGAPVNLCIPGGAAVAAAVSDILGREGSGVRARKAIVACQGTLEHRGLKYDYTGAKKSCSASVALHGGSSTCPYGCLGYGDCAEACPYDAIEVQNGVARVNMEKCTGCGVCQDVCPKRVIWIREVSEKPVVMCANHDRGAQTRKECSAGCIGCKRCEKVCPTEAIKVVENVARIDLDKCIGCRACVNECPVKAITVPKAV